jgi:8-oxo-dGTP pyrophosphatase MutT (NUDIX family)
VTGAPLSLSSIPQFDPRLMPVEGLDSLLPAVSLDRLSAAALRERFVNPPAWEPESVGDRFRLRPGPPRPAAVLVPIVAHPHGATVLLTERTAHLHDHAGQVAFPGGRTDPSDRSAVATALREAHEEIGLAPERVEILAELPHYLTGTGYQVTPVVGLVQPGFELRLDTFEVAEAFEVPLRFLMDPRHHERRRVVHGEIDRVFYAMPYRCESSRREYFIWGATAAMLRNVYRLLIA